MSIQISWEAYLSFCAASLLLYYLLLAGRFFRHREKRQEDPLPVPDDAHPLPAGHTLLPAPGSAASATPDAVLEALTRDVEALLRKAAAEGFSRQQLQTRAGTRLRDFVKFGSPAVRTTARYLLSYGSASIDLPLTDGEISLALDTGEPPP